MKTINLRPYWKTLSEYYVCNYVTTILPKTFSEWLEREHNVLVTDNDGPMYDTNLIFENEEDATAFVLRWEKK